MDIGRGNVGGGALFANHSSPSNCPMPLEPNQAREYAEMFRLCCQSTTTQCEDLSVRKVLQRETIMRRNAHVLLGSSTSAWHWSAICVVGTLDFSGAGSGLWFEEESSFISELASVCAQFKGSLVRNIPKRIAQKSVLKNKIQSHRYRRLCTPIQSVLGRSPPKM